MAETVGLILIQALAGETFLAAGGWAATVAPATLFGFSAAQVGSAVLIGGALVGGAVAASAMQQSPTLFSSGTPGDGTQTIKQGFAPRMFGYGRARMAGSYVFYEANATYSADVIALHYGRIEAWQHIYLNDDLVILSGPSVVSYRSANASTAGSPRYYNGQSFVTIETRVGLDTETHYSTVATYFSSVWGADHRGDKIASAMLFCSQPASDAFFATFPRGLPKLSAVGDLSLVYDPRTDDIDAPDTWSASRNPVWQVADFLTNADHGLGLSWDDLIAPNLAAWIAQADICDELVTRAWGNPEPRYRSSGFATMETDPADVLRGILSSCDGWLAENGDGTLTIYVGKYVTPTVTFTDDHIIGFSIDHGVADEEMINELKINHMKPANDYKMAAGVPWRDEAAIADMGRIRSQSLNFEWVQSHSQARRLAKRAMARHQARLRGMLTTNLAGLAALGKRWVGVQSDMIDDLSNAVVEITRARIDIAGGRVVFDWVLVNPNEIDAWETSEEGDEPLTFGAITKIFMPEITATSESGSPASITITDPEDDTLIYVVQWADTETATTWNTKYVTSYTPSGGSIVLTTDAIATAGTWYLRVAAINSENIWSAFATSSATV